MKYATTRMKALWSDESTMMLWWTVEMVTLKAQAKLGLVPTEWADALEQTSPPDVLDWKLHTELTGHEVVGFLRALGVEHVHIGMTSSDLTDTALALRVNKSTEFIQSATGNLIQAMDDLIERTEDLPRLARTHGQPAVPDTFGRRLRVLEGQVVRCADMGLMTGKIGGPVGSHLTEAASAQVQHLVMSAFDMTCEHDDPDHHPECSQIVPRDFIARWANDCATLTSAIAAIAMEIRLLSQYAIGEVAEGRDEAYVGSSAMPHKRNPNQSERCTGLARMARVMALALNEGIEQWNDRDLAHSCVEREFVPLLAGITEYAAMLMANVISDLEVNPNQMAMNLDLAGDLTSTHQRMVELQLGGMPYTEAAVAALTKEN